jgi:nicotinamide mononucleotide transporter
MSAVETAGALFGVASVFLATRQNVWCWPAGLVNVGLYTVVFWRARLYAGMGLQLVYAAMSVYGWWQWLHGGAGGGVLAVSRTPPRVLGILLGAGALSGAGLGAWLRLRTDAALPFVDAFATAFSLVAQYLATRKRIENWLVWIALDVVYVGMYLERGLYPTTGLYSVFLVLAARGLVQWRRDLGPSRPA